MLIKLRKESTLPNWYIVEVWIEQFSWIKLRPIVDELTENTLYLVCFIFSEDGLNWYVQFVPLVKCCVSYKLLGLLQSNLFQEKLLYELVQVQLKTILTTGYLMVTQLDQQKLKYINSPELIYM